MQKTIFTTLLLFITFLSGHAQFPDNLVLNLDFNNDFQDSQNAHTVTATNLTFAQDRFGNAASAVNFPGWCGGNPGHLKIDNAPDLQFTSGFTANFWASVDLSQGMDPSTGTCSANGHHMLFAKGGDGFGGSPNGIYFKYTNLGEHVMGTSPGSSDLYNSVHVPNSADWHMYTYTVTPSEYQFYLDGVLVQSASHTLNFNELNAEDIYLGILGPKSSPALGITDWFPLTGQLDDFLLFNTPLSSSEISSLLTFTNSAPSISRIERINQDVVLSGGRRYLWSNTLHDFSDNLIVSSYNPGLNNAQMNPKVYLSKVGKDSLLHSIEVTYQKANPSYSQIDNFLVEKLDNIYVLLFDYPTSYNTDSLLIFDSQLTFLSGLSLTNKKIRQSFVWDNKFVIVSESTSPEQTFVQFFDMNLNFLNESIINQKITEVDFNSDEIVLSNNASFFVYNSTSLSFAENSIASDNLFLTKENILLRTDTKIVLKSLNNLASATEVNVNSDSLYIDTDSSHFYILLGSRISKYDSQFQLVTFFDLPTTYDQVGFSNGLFICKNNLGISEGIKYFIFTNNGTLISEQNSDYFENTALNYALYKLNSGTYLSKIGNSLTHFSESGLVYWTKNIAGNDIFIEQDDSFWMLTKGGNRENLLVKINKDTQRCNYPSLNPFSESYCPPSNEILHTLEPRFSGTFSSYSYAAPPLSSLIKNYLNLGISFAWKKDGQVYSNEYFGEFSGNGNYSLVTLQGDCAVESPQKPIAYSNSKNPVSPSHTASKEFICDGESVTLTAICEGGSFNSWIDDPMYQLSYERNETLSSTTSYSAYCRTEYPRLDEISYGGQTVNKAICVSDNSNVTIEVLQRSATLNLTEALSESKNYHSGKIISSQKLSGLNSQVNYLSAKSVSLMPGFEAGNNIHFLSSIYTGCQN